MTSFLRQRRAASLAAAVVICLGVAPNTQSGATNTVLAKNIADQHMPVMPTSNILHENGEVLSQNDVALYRSVFDAQAKGNWAEADRLMNAIGDKRLAGYVLADLYQRRPATLPELQLWLAAYRDLPPAEDIYQQAAKLPGARKAKLTHPAASHDMGGGGYGYDITTGFRNHEQAPAQKLTPTAHRAMMRIDSALHRGDPATAKTMLEMSLQQAILPPETVGSLQTRIAAGYFYKGEQEEARHLTDVSYLQDNPRALWINGLSAFKTDNMSVAAASFVALANRNDLTDGDHAAAAFWAYRSLKAAGDHDDAESWLHEAAKQPHSFYGLLASNLSGQSVETAWSWHVPTFDRHAADQLIAIPAGARALALAQIGQMDAAENELRRLTPQGHRALQEAMLAFADKKHMPNLAMKLAGMSTSDEGKPYDAALYPVPPWQPSDGFHIDRALMYALMRHESGFDPTAVSSQGACGLMQLMPATADRMSATRAKHRSGECPDQYFDPAINLGLGQRYVRELAGQPVIGDNLLLLLAAYNGGPGRLLQRTDTDANADPLLFIESLQSHETHDYVQQVLMQYWTYRARLHQPLKSLDQLARGEWPRYALHDTVAMQTTTREASNDNLVGSTVLTIASNLAAK